MSSGRSGVREVSLRLVGIDCGSQKRIVCGTPSSVRVKSFAVRPSIVFPFLSLTTTVSMTICDRTDNVGVSLLPGVAFCPICWASAWMPSVASRRIVNRDRIRSKPQARRDEQAAHGVGSRRQSEERAVQRRINCWVRGGVQRRIPAGEDDMIKQVRRIDPQIDVVAVLQSEGPRERRIEGECVWAGDGISPCVSPLAWERRCVGGGIQMKACGCIIDRCTRDVRPDAARYASARYRGEIDRGLRQATARGDLSKNGPSLKPFSSPAAQQRSAAESHSRRVLNLRVHQIALIEGGKPALCVEVEPVLRDCWSLWARTSRCCCSRGCGSRCGSPRGSRSR